MCVRSDTSDTDDGRRLSFIAEWRGVLICDKSLTLWMGEGEIGRNLQVNFFAASQDPSDVRSGAGSNRVQIREYRRLISLMPGYILVW